MSVSTLIIILLLCLFVAFICVQRWWYFLGRGKSSSNPMRYLYDFATARDAANVQITGQYGNTLINEQITV